MTGEERLDWSAQHVADGRFNEAPAWMTGEEKQMAMRHVAHMAASMRPRPG